MTSLLDRLRQKPEATRVRYLFFSVGVSFVFVAALWVFSLKTSLGGIRESKTADTFPESFRDISRDAPLSLEALMKAGDALKEKGSEIQKTFTSPQNQAIIPPVPTTEVSPPGNDVPLSEKNEEKEPPSDKNTEKEKEAVTPKESSPKTSEPTL